MSAVTRITPHVRSLTAPDELKALPGWLMWRLEEDEAGKARKIPFYTSGERRAGVNGSATDRAKLTTFEAARTAAARRGFDGVGLALMPEFNITVLDFDHCVRAGQVDDEVLGMVADTYAELSPSGTGVHAVYRGRIANAKSPSTSSRWGFETFSDKGFVTWTGNVLEACELIGTDNTVAPINDQVVAEVHRRWGHRDAPRDPGSAERLGLTLDQARRAVAQLDPDMGFEHWLRVGMALHHELGPEGLTVWDEWSATGAKYKGTDNLVGHWRTFGRGRGEPVTMRTIGKMLGRPLDAGPASPEEFDALVDQPPPAQGDAPAPEAKPNRFAVIPAAEFLARPAPTWIVKGLLPRAELCVLFGESGSGKSFIALDIAAAIDRGIDWRGLRVKPGRVVYICAEGAGGFRNRMAAYQHAHQCSLDIGVIANAPNLLQRDDALDVCRAIGQADVVIIDTFAQTTPGANENAAEDMGKALAHCKGIHRATGALVILVHHAGKDLTRGARGWSGLKAAADAELEVLRTESGRMLRTSKMKDGEDDQAWGFDLEVQPVGMDEDGDVITSCTVREMSVAEVKAQAARTMGVVETVVHAVVMEMAQAQSEGIEASEVLKEAVKRLPEPDQGKRDTRLQRARRALGFLTEGDNAPFFAENGCIGVS
jgi:RecA/RadA recombinase